MKGKGKIIFIVGALLLVTSIFALTLSLNHQEEPEEDPNSGTSTPFVNEGVINTKISLLNKDEEVFSIQDLLTDFYYLVAEENNEEIYNLLEYKYIQENNITPQNAATFLNKQYQLVNYKVDEIYYNADSAVTYYFTKGYLIDNPFEDGTIKIHNNINALVIVGRNREYVIRPLDSNIDIESYAQNYDISNITIDNDTEYEPINISEGYKIETYLHFFNHILIASSDKAYSMLDNETKSKYSGAADFDSKKESVINSLLNDLINYEKETYSNYNVYTLTFDNGVKAKITEYGPMNYKVGY